MSSAVCFFSRNRKVCPTEDVSGRLPIHDTRALDVGLEMGSGMGEELVMYPVEDAPLAVARRNTRQRGPVGRKINPRIPDSCADCVERGLAESIDDRLCISRINHTAKHTIGSASASADTTSPPAAARPAQRHHHGADADDYPSKSIDVATALDPRDLGRLPIHSARRCSRPPKWHRGVQVALRREAPGPSHDPCITPASLGADTGPAGSL